MSVIVSNKLDLNIRMSRVDDRQRIGIINGYGNNVPVKNLLETLFKIFLQAKGCRTIRSVDHLYVCIFGFYRSLVPRYENGNRPGAFLNDPEIFDRDGILGFFTVIIELQQTVEYFPGISVSAFLGVGYPDKILFDQFEIVRL